MSPPGTLRGHLWAGVDRFVHTWTTRGLWRAMGAVWDARIRPLYKRYSATPDNLFLCKTVRTHHHPIRPHEQRVDIIVCAHNALEDVQNCLTSVVRHTRPPYRMILVDDGSDEPTRRYLHVWTAEQAATLIRHDQARGYTCAANAGLNASDATHIVLLNSDTVVTPLWLDRLVACADSEKHIGMVGPLSNAASWQSIPDVQDSSGDWLENPLPSGCSLIEWALLIGRHANYAYPRVPFLNGFCLLIKRELIAAIGTFDEQNFARGYGEENDYAIRARRAGWALALADDAYVWHRQSRSYSHERRLRLAAEAQDRLTALHGAEPFVRGCGFYLSDPAILGIRARARVLWERHETIHRGMERHEGRRVLFVLPTGNPGGGSHVIIQEARAMQRMGVDVRIFNFSANKERFQAAYPENTIPILYGPGREDLVRILPRFDAAVATLFSSVQWLNPATSGADAVIRAYYIQDFEPWFFDADSPSIEEARNSYTAFPGLVRMTKTEWNRKTLLEETGVDAAVVGPSVDVELFYPSQKERTDGRLAVAAMIRPETPRRNPEMTMQVLAEAHRRWGAHLDITLFGCEPNAPLGKKFAGAFPFRHAGLLTRTELAGLLPAMDIFLDFSSYQAMGLTALEAMASGAAVVVPQSGGADSFARHGENALVVDTTSFDACVDAVGQLVNDRDLLARLRRQSVTDAGRHHPEGAALRILDALFAARTETEQGS